MKTRVITALLLIAFFIPFLYFGSYAMMAFIIIVDVCANYELWDIKRKGNQGKIPLYIFITSLVFSLLMILGLPYIQAYPLLSTYSVDYSTGKLPSFGLNVLWLGLYCLAMLGSAVFDKRFSIFDALYTFGTVVFITLGAKGFYYLRSVGTGFDGALVVLYVGLVTCLTDTFAYIGGMTCYKLLGANKVHKLNERISPKKTIEGTIIGIVFGVLCGTLFGVFVLSEIITISWYTFVFVSFALSIAGQIGDLIFSAIKRHFEVKDYSKLLPGHGGVLDRIDSLIVTSLMAATIIAIYL